MPSSAEREAIETVVSSVNFNPEEDVKTVMEQAKASKEKAVKALEKSNGDLAEAILSLKA